MKKCSRCGSEILTGQIVCPKCGKPQRRPHKVRCRYCGTSSNRSLEVCPGCGEPLKRDWRRPVLLVGGAVLVLVLVAILVPWLRHTWQSFRPAVAVATVQSMAVDMPVLVEVPTLTSTLTPSVTPTSTRTPTPTPTPSLTPMPTLTPTPTNTPTPTFTPTPTPTPTATRRQSTATPQPTDTSTPTPLPTVVAPSAVEPEDGALFSGEDAVIKLAWRSSHTLARDECFLVNLRWTEGGAPAGDKVCVQQTSWYVDKQFHLRADQETERIYYWTVRLARRTTDSDGAAEFVALSQPSAERSFYWK